NHDMVAPCGLHGARKREAGPGRGEAVRRASVPYHAAWRRGNRSTPRDAPRFRFGLLPTAGTAASYVSSLPRLILEATIGARAHACDPRVREPWGRPGS